MLQDDLKQIARFFIATGNETITDEDVKPEAAPPHPTGFTVVLRDRTLTPGPPGVILDFGKV